MTPDFDDALPEALRSVRTRPLFVVHLPVHQTYDLGVTPTTHRRAGMVAAGTFKGARLSGEVLDGGNDWQGLRPDGALTLDVRAVLKAQDGGLIGMRYKALRHGPGDTVARIDRGEVLDPSAYYFRSLVEFETSAPQHDWLNRIFAVGVGHRLADGPTYSLFEVL